MAFTVGEANTATRNLRDAIADLEYVAGYLHPLSKGEVGGAQIIVIFNNAIQAAQSVLDQVIADVGD